MADAIQLITKDAITNAPRPPLSQSLGLGRNDMKAMIKYKNIATMSSIAINLCIQPPFYSLHSCFKFKLSVLCPCLSQSFLRINCF